jgi:hypothetical protein
MRRHPGSRNVLAAVGLALLSTITACSTATQSATAPSAETRAPVAVTFTDPFAYCASIGTVDAPDARYAGTPIPDSVVSGFKQAAGLASSSESLDQLRQSTIWRCMNGTVYVCNFGANLPCDSKADTNSTPSPEVSDYCQANPNADFIPLSVTGHATVYNWKCINGGAQAGDAVNPVDGRGFLQSIWYPIRAGSYTAP